MAMTESIAAAVGFVHLRVHTAYSLLEGALPIKKLAKLAAADKQPALAMTDTGNLFGAMEFSEAMAEAGIQPIIGCQLTVDFADGFEAGSKGQEKGALADLVLLAASEAGYWNLVRLVSRSFTDTEPGLAPRVSADALAGNAEGLIALTGGRGGPVDQALRQGQGAIAELRLQRLLGMFGDRLYVEIQRHGLAEEQRVEPRLLDLAYKHDVPIVATNEALFPSREDFEAHEVLTAIAESRTISEQGAKRLSAEHYFKTRSEMVALFADLPEAVANSVEIALRCNYRPPKRNPILPRFTELGADGAPQSEPQLLRRKAHEGLDQRLARHGLAPGATVEDYRKRLDYELGVIEKMKYPGYFLIVADFIQWAKARGIPVGPGRGSGAGSVVAWALTITDLDPIRFGLLFERFLNPERVSMPDFDIDFCQNRRDEVIVYVVERYGAENVAQIITFGTLQARAVLRDVGRVLQMPYSQVDRLTKLVPQNPANPVTLAKAVEGEPRLQQAQAEDRNVARLIEIALKLEGLYRHASTHAAGVVIGDRPLEQLAPLYRDPRSPMLVTQFSMKWVENAGLVKFDFLGLTTLTVLERAVELIKRRGIEIDLSRIPLDDKKTFEMLARGETVGVFQVESAGMKRALVDMHPDRFEDLIALVALYRPGPMANIPTYCSRKLGKEEVSYIHPSLEPILKETYGVITYQEQVMRIAQDLAGYSLGEADLLRRAMGKKIRSEMEKQRVRFMEGATGRGISREDADAIFEACAKFADYGFNKSHSAPYALITYQTAYLKANYPVEFLAASMSLSAGNTDKINDFRHEAQRLGIVVEPPSVVTSSVDFEIEDGRILYALAALKGVGQQAAEHIVELRKAEAFKDLADFASRIHPRILNKRALEALVSAGALDKLEKDRARVFAGIDRMLALANRSFSSANDGQNELFGLTAGREPILSPVAATWTTTERLQREHTAVGFYLSAHPLDEYRTLLSKLRVQSWLQFSEAVRAGATAGRLAGTVTARQERKTRTGGRIGIVNLSDPTGQYEAILFSEGLQQHRDLLEPGQSVVIRVNAEERPEGISVRIEEVEGLDKAMKVKQLRLYLDQPDAVPKLRPHLAKKGDTSVSFVLMLGEKRGEVEIRLPERFAFSPQATGHIKNVPGVLDVEMV
jgi:DNA polymerase-3 subunit alpha